MSTALLATTARRMADFRRTGDLYFVWHYITRGSGYLRREGRIRGSREMSTLASTAQTARDRGRALS